MNFKDVKLLVRTRGYMDHPVKEAVELWLHLGNFRKGMGLPLSHSWYPAMTTIKHMK
ncbi:hypothetical protein B7P43_G01094 [Cryptotermes secundus]|uniref:Uncharacterized protein n=1 Tax=Cryptotermes secundus TaxID=105785 RepID=A0A2J7PTF6_9NEOP|nr:hypothetical protein B7P43_G01094 [Cryptotermes secundus]